MYLYLVQGILLLWPGFHIKHYELKISGPNCLWQLMFLFSLTNRINHIYDINNSRNGKPKSQRGLANRIWLHHDPQITKSHNMPKSSESLNMISRMMVSGAEMTNSLTGMNSLTSRSCLILHYVISWWFGFHYHSTIIICVGVETSDVQSSRPTLRPKHRDVSRPGNQQSSTQSMFPDVDLGINDPSQIEATCLLTSPASSVQHPAFDSFCNFLEHN